MRELKTNEMFRLLKKRKIDSNKGDFGRCVLICGSYSMAGAAAICAGACVHSGVGIAHVICPDSIYPIVSSAVPEAVFTPVDDDISKTDEQRIVDALDNADCVVFGCGVGISDYSEKMLRIIVENAKVPVIIDADGINLLARRIELISKIKAPIILTPHPGEMSRLCSASIADIQGDREAVARDFAMKNSLTLVLKGSGTVIASGCGDTFINRTGNPGMACAGSGDMLCGIMAALICQHLDVLDAACMAVHIHGMCGDLSAERYSQIFTTPSTMIEMLPDIFKQIEKIQNGV